MCCCGGWCSFYFGRWIWRVEGGLGGGGVLRNCWLRWWGSRPGSVRRVVHVREVNVVSRIAIDDGVRCWCN